MLQTLQASAGQNLWDVVKGNQLEVVTPQAELPAQLIMFTINSVYLALPIMVVQQVVNCQKGQGRIEGIPGQGQSLAYLAGGTATVLDLHHRLFDAVIDRSTNPSPYLVVLSRGPSEVYAIPVDTVPALIVIPYSEMRLLPDAFRRSSPLGIANQVALVGEGTEQKTVFILAA